jgi:tetratricopeptide (TPR) repeat protein
MRSLWTIALGVFIVAALSSAAGAQSRARDAAVLMETGLKALDAGQFGDALEAFTEASSMLPQDANLRFGAGLAAFMLGRDRDAQESFERALALDPRYAAASEWLGELHYRAGRVKEAIDIYETALKRSPGLEKLESRLDEWRRESRLHERFYESRGAHFSVLFEGPADELLARRVVERLEAAYWRIGQILGAYPPQPIGVVLYTRQQFRDITRLPSWSAAAYDGRIHVPIRGALDHTDELDRVLGHEFVHAVVAMLGGRNVPVWLNEGLATLLESGGREEAEEELARGGPRPALRQLHGGFTRLSADEARLAYAVSTYAVQRMTELRSPAAVVTLLQDLSRGAMFSTSFHQHIGMSYEDFQVMISRQ